MGTSNSAQLRNLAAAREATSVLEQVLAESKRGADEATRGADLSQFLADQLGGLPAETLPAPETSEPLAP